MTCTGMLGKTCTCGKDHDLPITMEEDKPSMLANKWLWLSAVAAGLAWALVGWFVK